VEVAEPCLLAPVRALTGHLVVKPLVCLVLLRRCGVAELVVGVVGFDEVLDDGTGLGRSIWCVKGRRAKKIPRRGSRQC
jgi:hypothetical protein